MSDLDLYLQMTSRSVAHVTPTPPSPSQGVVLPLTVMTATSMLSSPVLNYYFIAFLGERELTAEVHTRSSHLDFTAEVHRGRTTGLN